MRLSISILSVIFLFITSCSNKNYFDNTGVYFCDAENLSANKKKFIHNGVHFGGGEGRMGGGKSLWVRFPETKGSIGSTKC